MPLQTVGSKTYDGKKEVETGAKSHREAVAAAALRSASSGKSSVGLTPTVNREIAMDFEDAQLYKEIETGRLARLKPAGESLRHGSEAASVGDFIGRWDVTRETLVVPAELMADRFEMVEPTAEAPPENRPGASVDPLINPAPRRKNGGA